MGQSPAAQIETDQDLIRVARAAIESRVHNQAYEAPPLREPSQGVFVTLHVRDDKSLRGCVGRMMGTRKTLGEEIASCAVAAAFQDPRFDPVEAHEVSGLEIDISLLEPEEPAYGLEDLDPKRWGVVVREGHRTGVLLPDIEGVDTAEEQVAIALRKAGIRPDADYALSRFRVTKIQEEPIHEEPIHEEAQREQGGAS